MRILISFFVAVAGLGSIPGGVAAARDRTPPKLRVVSIPRGTVAASRVVVKFKTERHATVKCRLKGGGRHAKYVRCWSPKAYNRLKAGRYTLSLRATDRAGNRSRTLTRRFALIAPARTP